MAMRVERKMLSDAQWARIEPLCAGKEGDRGRTGEDNRRFVEAVLWIGRTGAPWRDLPPRFGKWNTVFQRFRRWAGKGVFKRMFEELSSSWTWASCRSTGRTCACIRMRREKRGRREVGAVAGRPDDEDGGAGGRVGALGAFRAAAGEPPRVGGGGGIAQGSLVRRAAGGPGLRQRRLEGLPGRARSGGGDPAEVEPREGHRLRHGEVPEKAPRGELFLQDQALPTHRHPLRPDRVELRRVGLGRRLRARPVDST